MSSLRLGLADSGQFLVKSHHHLRYSTMTLFDSPWDLWKTSKYSDPCAMSSYVQVKSVYPSQELNPRPSTFSADALTTELRGWDNSTRSNFFTWHYLALSVQALTWQGLLGMAVRLDVLRLWKHGGKFRWEQSSSAPFVGSLGHRSFPTEAGDLQGGASHWCIDQDICTKHAMFCYYCNQVV